MADKISTDSFHYLQVLSEQTTKGIFAYQVGTKQMLYLNPAFETIWNLPSEKIKTDPSLLFNSIYKEDRDFLINSYQDFLHGNRRENIEFRIQWEDKKIIWVNLSSLALIEEGSGKDVITGFLEDITVVKKSYALVEKFAAKKNSILEILSHDLAGPLNNIKNLSSLLADGIKSYENKDLEKLVAMITNTSERSIHLIRDFVKQEFLSSANSVFTKRRVDIVKKVRESMEEYTKSEKDIAKIFRFTFSHQEIFMEVDDYKFLQVINNLISNAIKFTPDGGVISVHIEDKKDQVLFTVADDGIGIPEKYHETLFEKFTQARRPGLKGEPSTGLGMSIIKTIVEWHEGKIWFTSKKNEGSTFYIELPR